MFKFIRITGLLVITAIGAKSQIANHAISTNLSGQNAWMPDTVVTTGSYCYGTDVANGFNGTTQRPCILNGALYNQFSKVASGKTKIMRYGGNNVDVNNPSLSQYLEFVDSCIARNIEPILQVPYFGVYDTTNAKNIVTYINVTKNRGVDYWIIGNEENLAFPDGGNKGYTASNYSYIKNFSKAMKRVSPTIKIIAPELSQFDSTLLKALFDSSAYNPDFLGGKVPGKSYYYVDYASFHYYGFGSGDQTTYSQFFNRLRETDPLKRYKHLPNDLTYLSTWVNNTNTNKSRSSAPLKIAITEGGPGHNPTNVTLRNRLGCGGFVAGQWISEVMNICMQNQVDILTFWSMIEGDNGTYAVNNIGFLDGVSASKRSTYQHFKEISENFKGNYCEGTSNQANLKAFGSVDGNQISVLVLNESPSTNFKPYAIYLGWTASTSGNYVKIDADLPLKTYTDSIDSLSSTLLIFNKCGNIVSKKRLTNQMTADNGFTSVWAATSPAVVYTAVSAGSPGSVCCPGCSHEFTATSTPTASSSSYSWKRNGTNMGTGNPKSIAGTGSGLAGCYIASTTLQVGTGPNCSIVGIDDLDVNATGITGVIPNPTPGQVKISINFDTQQKESRLTIYDLSGRQIVEKIIEKGATSQEFDLTQLSNGLYTVTLSSEGQTIDSKRIMVTR